ncbi:MAG: fumarate hydratase [Bacillota bacterium]
MRILPAAAIEAAVAGLCVDATCDLPQDVVDAITDAYKKESSPGDAVLRQILDNRELARASRRPCCQDTGLAVVFLDIGQEVFIEGDVNAAVNAGVARAYTDAYLRKSSLTAISRENTGDNTPAILHIRFVPGDQVHVTVAPKGFGSENMSRLGMLKPALGAKGILDFIVETARLGAANACPPVILGVGVGGTMEAAALLAKRQLLRDIGSEGETQALREMEREALARVNALGIGPMGLGGNTTALAVHIGEIPMHLAGLAVAVNVQCHCARHASITL